MKVLLINIDSSLPNIALHKIALYHKEKGDEVIWDYPLVAHTADKIYVSTIFTKSRHLVYEWEAWGDKVDIGGTGFDVKKKLPKEIEDMKPKINIGFTTRGCIRKCDFCVVPEKEGYMQITGDIYDFWDGKSKAIRLLDNNPFAIKTHFLRIVAQIRKHNLKASFDGLDARLLDDDIASWLGQIRHEDYHFAFDNMADEEAVIKACELLKKYGIKRSSFYVLIGHNTNVNEDLYRLNLLKEHNQNGFVQRMNNKKEMIYEALASWANTRQNFQAKTFKQFVEMPQCIKRYREWFRVDGEVITLLKPLKGE